MRMLYLGAFDPSGQRNAATSTASVLFQTNFLDALVESGFVLPDVRCYYPVASFPRGGLICLPRGDKMANGLRVRSLFHVNLGPLKILTLGLSSALAVLGWGLRNRGRDRVVVSYNLNAPPAYFVGPVCRLLRIKFVPFIGDIYVPGEVVKDSLLRRIEFSAQKRAIPSADGLLVCNRAIVEDFAPGRSHVLVEGGVRQSHIGFSHTGVDDEFRIVFAGQLSELNGVRLLLDAMALVDDPDVRVTVMGGGQLEEMVRYVAKRDSRIEYLGLVDHERVLQEYSRADLLLNLRQTANQTHRYVFPSKVVECLSTGVPLLSTRTGHVESEFGSFVYLLDSQTPESLAAKLAEIKAMSLEDRRTFGLTAQGYVLREKTWEAQVKKIESYLREDVFKEAA